MISYVFSATWIVHMAPNGVKLQNKAQPEHWLRVTRDGQLEAKGEGGPLCVFEVVNAGVGAFALKSGATQLLVGFGADGQTLQSLEKGVVSQSSTFTLKPPKGE
jgi:hypothetical protein